MNTETVRTWNFTFVSEECFEGRVTVFDEITSVGAFISVEKELLISLELTKEKAKSSNI